MEQFQIPKAYEPQEAEAELYRYWEENRLFAGRADAGGSPFCMVIPPPNVTGTLHMGHALNTTLQDILWRYFRMKGRNALWVPGTDHAGIATQNVVERMLAREGLTRQQLGREKFIEKVWEWRAQYGGFIINQLKRLGAACDWSRERFTMDEGLSRAVREVFVRLHQEGLIYRGDYIINWCPRCHTALSDLEVEHEGHEGGLFHIRYPLVEGEGGITVATTRPETMLGDTAVAVHPDDPRYAGLAGKLVHLPLSGRTIPVIADPYVDQSFGTGALKITPAHDLNDFEIGRRHGLPALKVIDDEGRMNDRAGVYRGLDRAAARAKVLEDLEALGLLEKKEKYQHNVGHCYRCKTLVEPSLSKQWFVKIAPLAEKALAAVQQGQTEIFPKNWEKTYYEWMNNIRDWCISRQIWWGHQIPAWYCASCGALIVAREAPQTCTECGAAALRQETDVLDTWFSSALWPFSTLGWPERTKDLEVYYPTSVLVTGFDILFFWVARMMMMGLHFMDRVPFRHVYIHALVRDAEGQKMSKSKGNVIDPLTVMDRYGTDAFRFTLAALAVQGRDIKLSEERIEGYRHFVNKIWNAARFCSLHLTGLGPEDLDSGGVPEAADETNRWIISRVGQVIREVESGIEQYRFNEAAHHLYHFIWHEFCDWYLELIKPVLYQEDDTPLRRATRQTLFRVLTAILRLIHPFMPFVSEKLWQIIRTGTGSILEAGFPRGADFPENAPAEKNLMLIQGLIYEVRNLRGEMNVPPSRNVEIWLRCPDPDLRALADRYRENVLILAKGADLSYLGDTEKPPAASISSVYQGVEIFIPVKGVIQFEDELQRLDKEIQKSRKDCQQTEKKLANEDFLQKAPAEVVQKEKDKVLTLGKKIEKLEGHAARLKDLMAQG
ncbi:MAG: valine--tRNA ligase [Desulfobacterota bacterium]|jgi:valyl-tRNA synthetase|nr:valine--tRNA ligase [Thermodesulfobacteriota bacterium]